MQSPGREPSMEDILASIKKVIAEEKELRTAVAAGSIDDSPLPEDLGSNEDADVLELNEALAQLQTVAASVPAVPQTNPLEDMIREMLKPMLKQWLDDHLPQMVDEHVKREITRITGRPL